MSDQAKIQLDALADVAGKINFLVKWAYPIHTILKS